MAAENLKRIEILEKLGLWLTSIINDRGNAAKSQMIERKEMPKIR